MKDILQFYFLTFKIFLSGFRKSVQVSQHEREMKKKNGVGKKRGHKYIMYKFVGVKADLTSYSRIYM